jgi:hypothetical protein
MSPVIAVFNAPGYTKEPYDKLMQYLEEAGESNPKGRLYHVAAPTPDGFLVIDVWESGERLERFSKILVPLIQKTGATPAVPQIYPVHNIIS